MTDTPDPINKTLLQASMKDVSVDELLDDTIGLSFKSVKSIWLLFKNPSPYFTAAKAPFWFNSFSPSFRIYAGLTALISAMKFLYRDENSPMVKIYKQQFDLVKVQLIEQGKLTEEKIEGFNTTALAIETLKLYFIISPFIMVLSYTLLGCLYWGYGEKLNPVVRIRYVFAILIPASIIGILSFIPTHFLSAQVTGIVSFVGLAVMFVFIWITAYRGAFEAISTKSGKIGRATAISSLIFLFMMISSTITVIISVAFAMKAVLS